MCRKLVPCHATRATVSEVYLTLISTSRDLHEIIHYYPRLQSQQYRSQLLKSYRIISIRNTPNTSTHTSLTMSWFGGSSAPPAPPPPAASKDGGFIAPDRTARAQCWDGRDSFFKCLDRHSIIDSVREDKKAKEVCAPELREFESACASSWVSTMVFGAGESS
jgi:cytochrome c oxidase assembly factor 6